MSLCQGSGGSALSAVSVPERPGVGLEPPERVTRVWHAQSSGRNIPTALPEMVFLVFPALSRVSVPGWLWSSQSALTKLLWAPVPEESLCHTSCWPCPSCPSTAQTCICSTVQGIQGMLWVTSSPELPMLLVCQNF